MLGSVLTAMVTPFTPEGSVDVDRFRELATFLVDNGSDGVVVCGTTGESPTLSDKEKLLLFSAAREAVGERATVIAGTGTYDTSHSVHLTKQAATLGVDGNEAGIASAMVNTSQQVGGSVGTALLSTLFASSVASYTTAHAHLNGVAGAAAIHGYTTAFSWAAGIFALGLLLGLIILPGRTKARTLSIKTALARHAIANCHHVDLSH